MLILLNKGSSCRPARVSSEHNHLLRLLPRQRLNTIDNIFERLLVLLRRIGRRFCALDIFAVIPLDLKSRKHELSVEAVDIFIGTRWKAL